MTNFYKERRFAVVEISMDLFKTLSSDNLLLLYRELGVVVRLEDLFYNNITRLTVAHPRFCPVREGYEIPAYNILCESLPGELRISFRPVLAEHATPFFIALDAQYDVEDYAGSAVI